MTFQERRSFVFLVTNILVTLVYAGIVVLTQGQALVQVPVSAALWSAVILIWIPVQIVLRILVMIVLAVINQASGQGENLELEDELDKLLDLKATRVLGTVSMLFVCLALGSQVLGMSLVWFFGLLGGGIALAGIISDAVLLWLYRRGC